MTSLLTDPVVLICSGIILVCLFALFWAIGKFRQLKGVSAAAEPFTRTAPDFQGLDLGVSSFSRAAETPPAPAVSKDVADRLESMTQRLAEMQAVLARQSTAGSGETGGAPGTVGQGFSPETIDKLLKIIGNVMQQVDILQKSLNPPKV